MRLGSSLRSRLRLTSQASNSQVTTASQLTLRQSLFPLALVTVLFLLWVSNFAHEPHCNSRAHDWHTQGFAYGLLDTLNKHFQNTLHITRTRSSGLQAAYFGWGYKPVFIFGLILYGVGALCMWPAGLKQSFGGFCGATFVIGSGLGTLETAANPYQAVCGPPHLAELRINIAQGFNAIGTVIGPVLGSYVFFTDTGDSVDALKRVQWVYLAIAIFVFCLAGVFLIARIPEVTDADMEFQETRIQGSDYDDDRPFWKMYQLFHAAAAQFLYTGAQIAIASYFINYAVETRPGTSNALAAKFLAGAQGAFAAGRFVGAVVMRQLKPRMVFLAFITAVIAFLAASTRTEGNTGVVMLFLTLFFESVCFPTIVALGIRGLGKHYKRGSGLIVAGVSGGAAVPPLLGHVADMHNSTGFAMVVPTVIMAGAWTYAFAVNFVPAYRDPADQNGEHLATSAVDVAKDEEAGSGGMGAALAISRSIIGDTTF
ncbi:hypothetical protein KEM52_005604 [Ascosphaera acerosa]|nr:hypothetical protein KEM52_005604 [Ascosphaera acerosa]